MWDHVVESRADTLTVEELTAVLDDYFDAIRVGDATVSEREQYMASWIRAARERPGSGAVVVVCGGRHRPAIMSELARGRPTDGFWPAVPTAGPDVDIGSYLVPYSYSRLDLESPWWYEKLWQKTTSAGEVAAAAIVRDLRSRNQRVSTTDFIGFRTQILGLAAIRGHALPTRRDVLDAAASTLVGEAVGVAAALDTRRGTSGAPNPTPSSRPVCARCEVIGGARYTLIHRYRDWFVTSICSSRSSTSCPALLHSTWPTSVVVSVVVHYISCVCWECQDSSELQVQAVVLQWCRQNGG